MKTLWFEYENQIEDPDKAAHEIIKELCDMMGIEHLPENLRVHISLEGTENFMNNATDYIWGITIHTAKE